ncbi:hypothetical protein F5884DRAFT_192501 [Xylogone sp. PMI_703]|nr:hypothetical protein F5884DRAFT_192501 [Xylogone sp. PMI_703]
MSDWFRPVFHRAKSQPAPQGEQDRHESVTTPRIRSNSRVSSFLHSSSNAQVISTHDVFARVRTDSVPSVPRFEADQQVETLQVLMMTKSSLDPVPVEYNSCILQLLEGYSILRAKVTAKDKLIDSLKRQHEREVNDLRATVASLKIKHGEEENVIHSVEQNTRTQKYIGQNDIRNDIYSTKSGPHGNVAPDFSSLARRSVLDYLPWNKGSLKTIQKAQTFETTLKSKSQSRRLRRERKQQAREPKENKSHQAEPAVESGTASTHYNSVFYDTPSNPSSTSSSDSLIETTTTNRKSIDIQSTLPSTNFGPVPPGPIFHDETSTTTIDDYQVSNPMVIPNANLTFSDSQAEQLQGFSFRPGDDLYESFNRSPHGPRELTVAAEENKYHGIRCNYPILTNRKKKAGQKNRFLDRSETIEQQITNPYFTQSPRDEMQDYGSTGIFKYSEDIHDINPTATTSTQVHDDNNTDCSQSYSKARQQGPTMVYKGEENNENQLSFDTDEAVIAAIRAIAARSSSNASTSTQRRRSAFVAKGEASAKRDGEAGEREREYKGDGPI